MTIHTVRTSVLGLRGAPREIWNAGLAILESAGFGLLAPGLIVTGSVPPDTNTS